eukprot:2941999-Amphidinium_carterae.1
METVARVCYFLYTCFVDYWVYGFRGLLVIIHSNFRRTRTDARNAHINEQRVDSARAPTSVLIPSVLGPNLGFTAQVEQTQNTSRNQ